jgi:hypothetical protein
MFKLKIYLRTGTNMSLHPLLINPGMSSTLTGLGGVRCLITLRTFESEAGTIGKNSEDNRSGIAVYRLKVLGKFLGDFTRVAIMFTISIKLDESGISFPKGGNTFPELLGI